MTEQITIRKASIQDIHQILNIENLSFQDDAFSKNQFLYLLKSKNSFFYVACINNNVKGYIILMQRKNSKSLRIYSIAVDKESRGLNMGSTMIELAVQTANSNNFVRIHLEVNENNSAAVALYQKHQFSVFGSFENYYKDGSKALRMKKIIIS